MKTSEVRGTIHWPSKEQWASFVQEMRVGAPVPVMYNPDNPHDNMAFADIPVLERSIKEARKQLQVIESMSEK